MLRLVGGGSVEEDILQCSQSKLRLEHDLTASTDHGEGRGVHGHNIDTVFTQYGELHLKGFGECNYLWLYMGGCVYCIGIVCVDCRVNVFSIHVVP